MRPTVGSWLAVLLPALVGCVPAAPVAAPPPAAPSLGPAEAAAPSAAPSLTPSPPASASPVEAAGASTTRPSPVPAVDVPTARPRVPLRLGVGLHPPTPEVGQTFTLSLAITNEGTRLTEGVYVLTSGPWDRYTVLSIKPSGTFGRDAAGWHFVSPLHVAPGETQELAVDARADEPSDGQLTFAVRETDAGEVP